MKNLAILTAVSLTCLALPGRAQIVQTVDNNGSGDWDGADWGTPAAVPTSGNTYISAAGLDSGGSIGAAGVPSYTDTVRANDNGGNGGQINNVFAGSSLTLAGNTRLLLKQISGDTATANLILNNNSVIDLAGNNGNNGGILAGTISIGNGVTAYAGTGNNPAYFDINSTFSGSGTLDLFNSGGTPQINIGGNLSGFGGNLDFINGAVFSITTTNLLSTTLTFSTAAETASGSSFAINNALNVNGLVLGSMTLGNGTYTAAQLNADIGGGSFFTGASAITVVPEPSIWASLLGGLGLLLGFQALRRRTA